MTVILNIIATNALKFEFLIVGPRKLKIRVKMKNIKKLFNEILMILLILDEVIHNMKVKKQQTIEFIKQIISFVSSRRACLIFSVSPLAFLLDNNSRILS